MFGILQQSPKKWLGIGQVQDNLDGDYIESLINERNQARALKNFSKADEIRDILRARGWMIEDLISGYKLKKLK